MRDGNDPNICMCETQHFVKSVDQNLFLLPHHMVRSLQRQRVCSSFSLEEGSHGQTVKLPKSSDTKRKGLNTKFSAGASLI